MTTVTRKLKPNARQMAFIQHIVEGESEVGAYKLAGYAGEPHTLYGSASRLLRKDHIQAEIAVQRHDIAKTEGIDLPTIVAGLHENAVNAALEKQYAASTSAWVALGKALDLIVDKQEVKSFRYSADITKALEAMGTDELRALAKAKVLELPSAEGSSS